MEFTKIFLGGTCNNTNWRDVVMSILDEYDIDYFNPVVVDWTPQCIEIEERQKWHMCNIHYYHITPAQIGGYSFAEIGESSVKCKTVFSFEPNGFTTHQIKSLYATAEMVKRNGGLTFEVTESKDFEQLVYMVNELDK